MTARTMQRMTESGQDRTGGAGRAGRAAGRAAGRTRRRPAGARLAPLIALLVGAGALAPRLAATPAYADGGNGAATYTTPGEYPFTVPSGITALHAVLVGGQGGNGGGGQSGSGGYGAVVIATIPVVPGATLYVEVGGNGGAFGGYRITSVGGYNGGASTYDAGAGGGASDIRTCASAATTCVSASDTLHSRLLVAGGGGGGGLAGNSVAGGGGNADQPGATASTYRYTPGGGGGGAGTTTAGGAGGAGGADPSPFVSGTPGQDGSFGAGGAGGGFEQAGGGGGGGYYGGGGGGSANGASGGGGGGGASFVAAAAIAASVGTDGTGAPEVVLTYGQAPLTITANNKTMTYGGAVPTFDASYNGLVNGDTNSVVSGLSCGATDGNGQPVSSSTPVGTYPITCSGGSAANYIISYQAGTLTVGPAPLTITASSPTVVYNGAAPAITPGYSGFVHGDTTATLTTALTCASMAPRSGAAGVYTTSCAGAADPNYGISYQPGTLTITPAPQAITFAALPNRLLGAAPVTVSATGGASGNPVTFTAGPATVCTSGGTNGATITLVGVGTCTVTASQTGAANYSAAPQVTQHFAVSYPPLSLTLGVSSSPAGPITTGSVVTVSGTLTNHSTAAATVTLKATFSYVSPSGHTYTISGSSRSFTLAAGQTVGQPFSFTISTYVPRGAYTLALTATDTAGDTASGSASLTVV